MHNVKIAGIWELNWNTPLVESWQWTFPLREFEVTDWAMAPVSGITHNASHSGLQLKEYELMQDMVNDFADNTYTKVFIDETGATPLDEFEHPEKAVYFFGNAGRTPAEFKTENDLTVKIRTPQDKGVLWPHQCLLMVLHDRMMKEEHKIQK